MAFSHLPIMRSGRHSAAAAAAVAIAPTWREAAQSASEQDGWWMKRWSELPQLNSAIIYSASDTWRYGATLLRNRKRFTEIFYRHCSLIGTSTFCAPVHKAYMLLQTILLATVSLWPTLLADHRLRYKSSWLLPCDASHVNTRVQEV